jgi:hypothetical protein
METTAEERAGLMPRLRTGLMAVAAFVRGTVDMEPRMNDALDALDVVEKVLRDIDRLTAGPLAGMEAEIARLTEAWAAAGMAAKRRQDEIARLTAELAEAQTMIEASPTVQKAMGRFHTKLNESYKAERDQARADVAKAMEEEREACAKLLDAAGDAEGALFLGATERGDHVRSLMFNSAANAYRAGAAVIRARSTKGETP